MYMIIDCEYVSVKINTLTKYEKSLEYAVDCDHDSRYWVFEMACICIDPKDTYVLYPACFKFSSQLYLPKKYINTQLQRQLQSVVYAYGLSLNPEILEGQLDVGETLKAIVEQNKVNKIFYKGGQCEKALISTFTDLDCINLEDIIEVGKAPLIEEFKYYAKTVENPQILRPTLCKKHHFMSLYKVPERLQYRMMKMKRGIHCALHDVCYYANCFIFSDYLFREQQYEQVTEDIMKLNITEGEKKVD